MTSARPAPGQRYCQMTLFSLRKSETLPWNAFDPISVVFIPGKLWQLQFLMFFPTLRQKFFPTQDKVHSLTELVGMYLIVSPTPTLWSLLPSLSVGCTSLQLKLLHCATTATETPLFPWNIHPSCQRCWMVDDCYGTYIIHCSAQSSRWSDTGEYLLLSFFLTSTVTAT